ncbi:hypothetical protein BgAZ_103110 [Babesia gibsoni]|uniref:RRM domain-containing protein n=1 Tax=Babesia gibsoni TaxID=33632 RepID=A0AAD8PFD6_BABGI|nr:hypothetical protein BgAZ_103110 [Babesia gibsoni]
MPEDGLLSSSTAYVAPVSPNVTEEHMREIAENFGKISSLECYPVDKEQVHVRIAKIAYESKEGVESLMKHMDKGEIDGLRIRVTLDEPKAQDLPSLAL